MCLLLFVYRPLLPLVTTTATWAWVWSAPRRWPQPSVGPSSWPSCLSSLSEGVTGVTKSANPTLCPARWLAAAALSWCVSFQPPVVPASCLPQCPRSCSWWLESMIATPLPGAAPPPSATLVSFSQGHDLHTVFGWGGVVSPRSAQLHLGSGVVVVKRRERIEYCTAGRRFSGLPCYPFTMLNIFLPPTRLLYFVTGAPCYTHLLFIIPSSAKATFDAISKTYSYLTPDLWKETVFTKSPYQVCTEPTWAVMVMSGFCVTRLSAFCSRSSLTIWPRLTPGCLCRGARLCRPLPPKHFV